MKTINVLVLGMGSYAFGREKRAVRALSQMRRIKPYFLTSKWGDGSVSGLLQQYQFEFSPTSFGYLGRARPVWTLVNLLQMPRLFVTLIHFYLTRRCKVILILNLRSFVNALPSILLLKFLGRARLIFYLGDIPDNDRIHRTLGRLINRLADRLIANSGAVKRGLVDVCIDKRKIDVIYNGLDLRKFENSMRNEFREKYRWPSNTILVGYAGQFSENKGIWDFVRAAELVLQHDPNCRFVMIGKIEASNGVQRSVKEHLIAQGLDHHVVFTGWMGEIESAFSALDVVVVPSRYADPAPNVSIEAMASGVPVVGTRMGGIPELVLDGETGFLVDKENPGQIAARIDQLAGDAKLREKMGRAGRERVRQMFDVRKNAPLVEEVLLDG